MCVCVCVCVCLCYACVRVCVCVLCVHVCVCMCVCVCARELFVVLKYISYSQSHVNMLTSEEKKCTNKECVGVCMCVHMYVCMRVCALHSSVGHSPCILTVVPYSLCSFQTLLCVTPDVITYTETNQALEQAAV